MNGYELEEAWLNVCKTLETYEDVVIPQMNAFFSRIHPQAMSQGFLLLTADNDFIKTRIERDYLQNIKKALKDIHGVDFNVFLEVDPKEALPQKEEYAAPPSQDTRNSENRAAEQDVAYPHRSTEADSPRIYQPEFPQRDSREDAAPTMQPAPAPREKGSAPFDEGELADDYLRIGGPIATYTFENFVIGDSNRMARSMALSVAESPGKAHLNPLFIYGKSGLGKTHLLRAIQNYICQNYPKLNAVYADSAEFLNDYVEAAVTHEKEKSSFKNFKKRYESADVLLIDDVQWLQGKGAVLEIVFQLFNSLTNQGKQVVLSADRAPKNIDIDERYKSRFNQGGTVSIQPPEIETKLGIIKSFVEDFKSSENRPNFRLADDIQLYIADISSSNVRELKSAVTRVITKMIYSGQDITIEEVRDLLENHFSGGPSKRLSFQDIQNQVAQYYKVSIADITGKKRTRNIAYARQIAIFLCRTMLDAPYAEIGKKFNREHATIIYSVNLVEQKLHESREMQEEIESLKNIIREA